MLTLQGTGRYKRIVGRKYSGEVETIRGLVCQRKHVINSEGWAVVSQARRLFAFVSSPKIYKQTRLINLVKGWCHGFRKPKKYIPGKSPKILLPESDFMDPMFVPCKDRGIKKEYDYFYFTINASPGLDNKGLKIFIESLPELCRQKLRGLIIVYFPNSGHPKRWVVRLSDMHQKILEKHKSFLTYKWGLQSGSRINKTMQSCRFGFFPNTVDNSPRLISECLIRNTPILINKDIHGGWHYVSKETGSTFDLDTLRESIDKVMTGDFHPREYYMSRYGFETSSKKLAGFLREVFNIKDYSHVYFSDFKDYLREIR